MIRLISRIVDQTPVRSKKINRILRDLRLIAAVDADLVDHGTNRIIIRRIIDRIIHQKRANGCVRVQDLYVLSVFIHAAETVIAKRDRPPEGIGIRIVAGIVNIMLIHIDIKYRILGQAGEVVTVWIHAVQFVAVCGIRKINGISVCTKKPAVVKIPAGIALYGSFIQPGSAHPSVCDKKSKDQKKNTACDRNDFFAASHHLSPVFYR